MKKLIMLLTLGVVLLLAGCAESDAAYDKEANPESGVIVFVGYDKKEYFIVESDSQVYGYSGGGYMQIDLGNGESFNTNDVYYKFVFKDKEGLNKLLTKYGFEEMK